MKAGRYDPACKTLESSYALDPRLGTLFTVADCYANWGKVATAVEKFRKFLSAYQYLPPADKEKHAERSAAAQRSLDALLPRVPHVTLHSPGNKVQALKIDGKVMDARLIDRPIAIDPGEHVAEASAPLSLTRSEHFVVGEGESREVTLVLPPAAAQALPPEKVEPPSRMWLYVAGGVGAAGLALGGIAGGIVLSKKSAIENGCPDQVCSESGQAALDAARPAALASEIGFAFGAAGLGTAIVLWALEPNVTKNAPKNSSESARVVMDASPNAASASLRGRF